MSNEHYGDDNDDFQQQQQLDDDYVDICQCCMKCCSYPNGRQAIYSQVLLLIGFLFGTASIMDCSFVQVQRNDLEGTEWWAVSMMKPEDQDSDGGLSRASTNTIGLGFVTHQDELGNCQMPENLEDYSAFLGANWCMGRFLAGFVGLGSATIWMIWLGSLACSAQSRLARNVLAFFIAICTAASMAITFAALSSDLCTNVLEHGCQFSSSAGYAVIATVSFLTSGVVLQRGTYDYPPPGGAVASSRRRKTPVQRRGHQQESARTSSASSSSSTSDTNSDVLLGQMDEVRMEGEVIFDGLGDAQEVPVDPTLIQATLGVGSNSGAAGRRIDETAPSCCSAAARDVENSV